MIPRHLKITFALLIAAALATGVYVWTLNRHARQAPQNTQLQQPVAPPTAGAPVTVSLYLADDQQGTLRRDEASLSLPSAPSLRAQAVLRALIARYTQKDSPHPLPAGADVNDVYVVNTTAVVDLNDAFASGHRSGVMVEEMTVLSLVQTLAATLPGITQVKILVNGQERDTLAGHADLADFYDVATVNRVVAQMGGASGQ
ncbi:MAG TPA: GerMN domain-containing protein [Terriglobales bacterium]|nr:GerMN domain-containing protein [Terriglobales bacterium]